MTLILVDDLDLLFIHVPQTGGTAVRRYLVDNLGGVQVAPMHQVWEHAARDLPNADRLRIMTGIRHPMDQTLSSYRKLVTDHRGQISRGLASERRIEQHEYIMTSQADFETWFLRFRTRVLSPRWLGSVRRSTWVLRFESLEQDFLAALVDAGVEDAQPLGRVNVTQREPMSLEDAYCSDRARRQAARIFGPFMAEFGYDHPPGWSWRVPQWASVEYALGCRVRAAQSLGLRDSAAWVRRGLA